MSDREEGYSRRRVLGMAAGLSGLVVTSHSAVGQEDTRMLTLAAKPESIAIDATRTAVIVIDMQNDFGAEGGMFHRAGNDISLIRSAIAPTSRVLAAARKQGVKVIYSKMAFKPDLSDAGPPDSPLLARGLKRFSFGTRVKAPNGTEGRILVRDTWNTDILPELTPKPQDIVFYKHRFSGFYQTELDSTLKRLGVRNLVFTGCTTSVCIESTIRDARFRDYVSVLLADCTAEPVGNEFPRSNHAASLYLIERQFGWISTSSDFIAALDARPAAAATSKS